MNGKIAHWHSMGRGKFCPNVSIATAARVWRRRRSDYETMFCTLVRWLKWWSIGHSYRAQSSNCDSFFFFSKNVIQNLGNFWRIGSTCLYAKSSVKQLTLGSVIPHPGRLWLRGEITQPRAHSFRKVCVTDINTVLYFLAWFSYLFKIGVTILKSAPH